MRSSRRLHSGIGGYDNALARLPGVTAVAPFVGVNALRMGPGGKPTGTSLVEAPLDSRFGRTLEVPKMLAGRAAEARPGQTR